jgi:hypothetical protein
MNDRPGDFGNFLNQRGQESRYVGASRKIGALPGPQGQKICSPRRLGCDREVSDQASLQRVWQDLGFLSVQLLHQTVVNSPCQSSRKALRQRGVPRIPFQQGLAMKAAGTRFLARQKYRSHLDGLCAKRQRRYDPACISYASGGDHGHVHAVDYLRHERQCANERILGGPNE